MTSLGNNNDSKTCVVNQNGFVHFTQNGRVIASVNSNGQNLGNVTATSFLHGNPLDVPSCLNPSMAQFNTAVLERSWVITPQNQPQTPVNVRLYYSASEVANLSTLANNNANGSDDVMTNLDLLLSKYSNTVNTALVNNSPFDNCTSGISELFNLTNSGLANALITCFDNNGYYSEFTIPGFSEFWLHGSSNGSALPVTLSKFEATCNDVGYVEVRWQTESETNSSHFIVEHSRDGINWLKSSPIQAAQYSNTTLVYNYLDLNSGEGFEGYYRLVQVDLDGTSTTYNPVMVSCNELNEIKLSAYPNPTSDLVNIYAQGFHSGDAQLTLSDFTGKIIQVQTLTIGKGSVNSSMDIGTLAPGIYIANFIDSMGESRAIRIIKP
jgi:hypothetical protein